MPTLSPHEIALLFLSIGVLLGTALIFGEVVKRLGQPAVVGEILAGIVLGPTVLGTLAPGVTGAIFPRGTAHETALEGLTTIAVALFLLVAGMEVDLSRIWRQGKSAFAVSVSGLVVPFAIGFMAAWAAPEILGWERSPQSGAAIADPQATVQPLVFALFVGTAMAISAVPVIAKILMDLNLFRTDLGMVLIAAAIFDDLIGWILFAMVLALLGAGAGHGPGIAATIWMTLGFTILMLTVGRWLIHKSLPWIQAHTAWPGGVLGFALVLAFLGAAFTEWIGVHAIFGAFIVGVALGDSSHLREQTRFIINHFINFIFAPLFVAAIGLKVNFAARFDLLLVVLVLALACVGKVAGALIAGRLTGMERKERWALGFGLNARGEMGIILGLLALESAVIGERLFVALVVMAIVTSMMSGPAMDRILKRKRAKRFHECMSSKTFVRRLVARDRETAIAELAQAAAGPANLDARAIRDAVWSRELSMPTALGQGVATPHARLEGLNAPVAAVGMSAAGIDFNAPDGEPAHIVLLLLTPREDATVQLQLLADVARTFSDPDVVSRALKVAGYTEFRALLQQVQRPG
jgi:Kef-type K+ transport system membrane component KefB/mannitol/fructose-specific phosphotransferase system IIA component (Ntr-type)